MLAEKNGLRSVWRSKGKACLFFLLLLVLTAVLALGLCIYSAVDSYLDDCNQFYRTIANLEYIGREYGDNNVYDEKLASMLDEGQPDIQALQALPGVTAWEPNAAALAVGDGLQPPKTVAADKDAAVLVVSRLSWDDATGAYFGTIRQCLYSFEDNAEKLVFVSPNGLDELDLENSRTYLFAGSFTEGQNGYLWFRAEPGAITVDGETVAVPAYMPLEGDVPDDSIYWRLAQAMKIRNNGLRMQMIGQTEDDYPFQQQELYIAKGRTFSAQEVETGARVCLISQRAAAYMNLSVGDTVDFSLFYSRGDGIYSTLQLSQNADFADTYQIVGLFCTNSTYDGYVFVPNSTDYAPDVHPTGYTLGQFRLENGQATAFYEAANDLLPDGFRLTVYDQGYETTAAPFQELLRIAGIFLTVCVLVILAALCLFAYLFVYRQWEAAQIMYALGSGKGHIFRYFFAGSGSIALLAASFGAFAGSALEQTTLQMVASFVEQYQTSDLRYSVSNLSVTKSLEFLPDTPVWLYVLAAGLMVLLTLVACAVFTFFALHKRPKKKKRKTHAPRRMAKSSRLSGRWKYAVLSVRRGGLRTAAVLLLTMVVAMFLGQLTSTANVYRDQLAEISANTKIRGYVTDTRGLQMDNLVVHENALQSIYETGLVSSVDITTDTLFYRIEGVRQGVQGNVYSVPTTEIPSGSFAKETFLYQMSLEPKMLSTNSLTNAPDFYYSPADVTWLDGYDESCLRSGELDICVMPESRMEQEGIELGDVVRFFYDGEYTIGRLDMYVVGSYQSKSGSETVYIPLNYEFPLQETTLSGLARPLFPEELSAKGLRFDEVPATLIFSCGFDILSSLSRDGAIYFSCPGQSQSEVYWQFWNNSGSYCVMHYEQKAAYGLEFGDTITLTNDAGQTVESTLVGAYGRVELVDGDGTVLQQLGSFTDNVPENQPPEGCEYQYVDNGSREVYCTYPADCYTRGTPYDQSDVADLLDYFTCKSAVFTLNDASELDALRQSLEDLGCRAVNQPRGRDANAPTVVLDDKDYVAATDSLERQILYLDILYRCLYVCTGILGLVVSYLLVAMRKQEIGIMRSLGAQRLRIFGSFFAEQLVLALTGCGIGLGLWLLAGRPCNRLCLGLTGAFVLCWLVGTSVSIIRLLCSKALTVLSDRE